MVIWFYIQVVSFFFFFNDTATTEIYTLSLHDALPIIVLLSDGKNTLGVNDPLEVAEQARQARIPIFGIALGTERGEVVQRDLFGYTQHIPVPPDKETLRRIASITGGRFFEAVSSEDAEQIYSRIGTRLTSRPEQREVTVAFAGGAFVLLVAGGALSLVWFGRLP